MKIKLIIFAAFYFLVWAVMEPALSKEESIKNLGTYSNVRHTHGGEDEHAAGYTVTLWQNHDGLFGVITSQYGLADVKPCGLLTAVKFDQQRKSLKFESKLSEGSTFGKGEHQVPSRDLFQFSGVLGSSILRGRLTQTNMLDNKQKPQVRNVELRKTKGIDASRIDAKTYSDWKKQVGEQLNLSGPKW